MAWFGSPVAFADSPADRDGGGEHGEAPRESSRMEARSMAGGNAADQSGSDSLLIG